MTTVITIWDWLAIVAISAVVFFVGIVLAIGYIQKKMERIPGCGMTTEYPVYTLMTDEDRRSLDKEKGPDELYGDDCPGERGNTRAPKFGEWMRGVWASEINPHRDGMFVRTVRRTGHVNNGTWHELTDGKGNFWQYEAKSTVFLTPNPQGKRRRSRPS